MKYKIIIGFIAIVVLVVLYSAKNHPEENTASPTNSPDSTTYTDLSK